MSVRHEEPLPEIEAYRDLAPGTAVEARENDADIPVGARGTVARRIPETGNWQCVFEVEAGQRRVVSLCPDQLRPVSVAAEPERPVEGEGFAAAFLREAGWPGIVPVAEAGPRDWRGSGWWCRCARTSCGR